jgi:hypothetical protein
MDDASKGAPWCRVLSARQAWGSVHCIRGSQLSRDGRMSECVCAGRAGGHNQPCDGGPSTALTATIRGPWRGAQVESKRIAFGLPESSPRR